MLEPLEPRVLLAADVVISEIMYQSFTDTGLSEDYGEEFVELHNRGDAPADLLGWKFTNGIDFEFPDVTLGAGEYLVVAANPNVFNTNYPTVTNYIDGDGWEGHLSNSGEKIELEDTLGVVIDMVTYADEGDWAVREWMRDPVYGFGYSWSNLHDGGGHTLEVINPAMTNNSGQNWSASIPAGGTPGAANSVFSADIAPLIRNVEHYPIIPTASDAVTVVAKVQDELTTGLNVVLHYRDDGDPTFNTAVMYDDGLHNDENPGDEIFGAEIPARPDGTIVEFYIEATDAGANSRTWPAPVTDKGQTANCLYQVDDSFTEDWTPGDQPVWRVILTAQEWIELDDIEDNHRTSNAQRNVTFISTDGVSTKVRYEAAMRNRGNGSRGQNPHNQRINLPHDRPWQGYNAMTINSRVPHSQAIGSAVFRYADVPAIDTTPIEFLINGVNYATGGMYNRYVWLEALDNDMAAGHWPDDDAGHLYKCNDSNGPGAADLDYEGENPDNYRIPYVKQTNVAADDYSGLIRMLDVLNNAPAETYIEDVAAVIDIDQWVRFLAVDTLLANGEGGLTDGRGDDYAMYQGVLDPRFTLVPYDLDTVLGTGGQSQVDDDIWEYRDPSLHGLERLLSQPEVIQKYYAQLLELCDTVFAPETINPLIDQVLGGWVSASRIATMKQFVVNRVANVRTQVANDPLWVTSSLPLSGGYPRATSGSVGLSGTASGAYTRSVLVNGRLAVWDQNDGTWYFDDGSSTYQEQILVGSDSTVTYHIPTTGEDALAWTARSFDDSGWIDSISLDAAGVLITEISTGDTKFVEMQNVSVDILDTTDWQVLINDASGGINVVNSTPWSLPASISGGEVLYQTDSAGDNYWGASIDWAAEGPGWVMIVDDGGTVKDFVAWGYTAVEIAALDISFGSFPSITVGDQWSGDGAPVGTAGPGPEAPTVDITDVTPDPHNSAVDSIEIVFSKAVTGFDVSDLTLTLDGGADLLTGAESLVTGDSITWTLGGLGGLTNVSGTYALTLTAAGSGIQDTETTPQSLVVGASDDWLTDVDAPTADITDIAPDPHNTPVDSVEIVFSEAIANFDITDLSLTLDGGANLLTGGESLGTGDNITWTLGGLGGLTTIEGIYTLTLTAAGSGIQDAADNPLAADASDAWETVGVPPTADVIDVTPDPRTDVVSSVEIVFSEAVANFDITDLTLTLDGGADLLTGAESLGTSDNITWTLGDLAGLTAGDGTYALTLTAAGSGIEDAAGNPLAGDASDTWVKYTQVGGWVAFNDHMADTGTHVNTTTYAGNGTASGELKDITTGIGTGATLTITADQIIYDNNGSDPPLGSDAFDLFNGFVDFGAGTGASIEVEAALGASYTHTFSDLDTGAATYDLAATSIRGNNSYTNRWLVMTLTGAEDFTSAHSTGDGVITSDLDPSLDANQVVIWVGDNSSTGQGWVAHWTEIDPGPDGLFAVVSEQYTGAIPTNVDAGGVADGRIAYGITGIRLEEIQAAPAPPAVPPSPATTPAAAPGDGFVAYNDHIADTGTHANTTEYSARGGSPSSGFLKDIDTGADTVVTLTVTAAGVNYASSQSNPAAGTDAYALFNGFVDLGGGTGTSIETTVGDNYTYTFSGLDMGDAVTYTFHGTAIRGNSGYTDRWTLVTLVGTGAGGFSAAPSSGDGVITSAFNPNIASNQMVLWTGDNSRNGQGFVAGWTDIDPGGDGIFAVTCAQYTGAVPTTIDPAGIANGNKCYSLSGIRLEEVAPSGPQSWLKRKGDTDGDTAADFARSAAHSKGEQNPDMTVPFGSVIPTAMGIGFSDNQPAFDAAIGTDVGDAMQGVNASLFSRIEFTAGPLAGYDTLTLRMKYDDGFVAYLNGTEVACRNADNPVAWNTVASGQRDNGQAVLFEDIDISAFLGEVVLGANVLAIHAQNISAADADLLVQTELKISRGVQDLGLDLQPGLNRVVVEAFDGEFGTGDKLDETHIDIWSDTGPMNNYPQTTGGGPRPVATSANLIVRDSFLPGQPVLVRVEVLDDSGEVYRDLWDETATLTADNGVTMDVDQITMFNGLGSALVTFTGSGPFNLTATAGGFQDSDGLADLTGAAVTTVSGTLSDASGTDTWSGVVHVTGDVLVPAGHTLSIQAGTLVRIDGVASGTAGTDIDIVGDIQSLGTADQPITFTAYNPAEEWGEIHHAGADPSLYQYTNIILAGHSPGGGHTGSGPAVRSSGSTIVFEYTNITDNYGKVMQSTGGSDLTFRNCHLARSVMGPEIDNTALVFENNWITENHGPDDNDGIYIHSQSGGQTCTMSGGVIADMHDDGLDTLHATVLVEDYIFRDMADKGSSVYGGEVTYNGIISANNDIGISAKDESHAVVHIDHATITGNRWGIQAENKDGGKPNGLIEYFVTNSIIYGNTEWAVRSDFPLDPINIDYSIVGPSSISDGGYRGVPDVIVTGVWPGTSNDNVAPLFVAPGSGDFHLQPASTAIDAGNDGKDLGFYADIGPVVPPTGELAGDTTWRPEDGQYRLTGDLTVPAAYTLTIMPGTTVFFEDGASLIVEGRLDAQGEADALIRFAPAAGASDWDGIHFLNTMLDNRITHAIIEGSTRTDGMIELDGSNLLIDHAAFGQADRRRITSVGSSLIVRNSTFADFVFAGSPPNNVAEHIWGRNVNSGGQFILENNVFGLTPGHNDALDFDAGLRSAGDPVPQILNNVFLGGGDDALDIEGDFHVEGNVFMHYRKDAYHDAVDAGEANVISAGDSHGTGHEYTVTRNVFYDADHVTLIKEDSFMTFTNNTVVNVDQGPYADIPGAINFNLIGQTSGPGIGAYVDGCIFTGTPLAFNNLDTEGSTTDLIVNRSILPAAEHGYGADNVDADPRLADPAGGDFSLRAGSPAMGAGPVGQDMGADVPAGTPVSAVPLTETYLTGATFDVAGDADPRHAGFLAYRHRLNGGAWSADRAPGTQIVFSGLGEGLQTLEVISQNFAGVWQADADAILRSWTVNTSLSRVLVSEVLAINRTAHEHDLRSPDAIELYNYSLAATADLEGWSITDNPAIPTKYVFVAGTTIAPDSYLVLYAETADAGATGIYLGFDLDGDGQGVYLYDDTQTLVDSVAFGLQIPDLSIARTGADRDWSLAQPTIGSANIAQPTADPDGVLINEWFTNGDVVLIDDFIELHNPDTLPVRVDGLYVTDNPANQKTKHQIAPLSFIGAQGFRALKADDTSRPGHVDFRLRANMEILGLFDADVGQLDRIYYSSQTEDISQGRTPDGSNALEFFTLPTPDVGNVTSGSTVVASETLVAESDAKHVLVPTGNIGTTWRTDLVFDTTGWHYWGGAPAGVGYDSGDGNYDSLIGLDVVTEMDDENATCYIRIPFTFAGDPNDFTDLSLNVRYDDGFIAYLNGHEIYREEFGATDIPVWNSGATDTHDDGAAIYLTEFDVSLHINRLNTGDNLLAIHGLNNGDSSSDFLISAELVGITETSIPNPFTNLLAMHDDLRITELMYNPSGSDSKEFIELRNTGTTELQLEGLRFTDGVDFVFPAMTLGAGQYVVIARELSAFEGFHGTGINAIGDYDPDALSNGGEDILLQMPAPYDAAILRFDYNDNWYPSTDGDGASLVIADPLGRRATWDSSEAWYPSGAAGGSPGVADPTPQLALGSVVVNELLAHSDGGVEDWIELYNATGDDIDISGWFLSDDPDSRDKFEIPATTILHAGEYLAFNEIEHFGGDFALSEHGDVAMISSADGSYLAFAVFDATANGVTLGRHTISTGEVDFVAMSTPTYEAVNSGPLIGPIVIEEIMYNPQGVGNEYILLRNIAGWPVPLYDPTYPDNTWKLDTGGIEFVFPQGVDKVTVPIDGFVLITDVDPATYLAAHTVAPNVQLLGSLTDPLSNGGDTVTLYMPGNPEPTFVPYIAVETVKYNDRYPWPDAADGDGPALSRLVSGDYGNDPDNWGVSGGPVVTVDPLTTTDTTPQLTGGVTDSYPPTTVTVTVDGTDYIVPVSGGTWTLADDTIAPALGDGTYDVSVSASDIAGNTGTDSTIDELVVDLALGVVGRHVFYNNSTWDGNDPLAGASDDAAAAIDKTALLPGGTAGPANYTSYYRGINGVMVDIDDLPGAPTAADFVFEVNSAGAPDTWMSAPAPTSVTVRPGAGTGGKDRITIIWADGAIRDQWLKVTVLATPETGLAAADVFHFGSTVGDADGDGQVTSADYGATLGQFGQTGGIGSLQADFNCDSRVDFGDFATIRASYGNGVSSPTPPAAPDAPSAAALPVPDVSSPTAVVLSESSDDSNADAGPPAPAASAPAVDLLAVSAFNGYVPQPPAAAIGSAAETLYRAAMAEDALATETAGPVIDGLYQSVGADDLLDDLLTASPLAIRL